MSVETGRITTDIPARLDRLPWVRWHWLVVIGLGITGVTEPGLQPAQIEIYTQLWRSGELTTRAHLLWRVAKLADVDAATAAFLPRAGDDMLRFDGLKYLSDGGARYRQSGLVEIPFLAQHGEPLMHELRHFATCVQERRTPLSSGTDGLAALEVAITIRDQILAG